MGHIRFIVAAGLALAAAGCASGGSRGATAAPAEATTPLGSMAWLTGAWEMERDGTRWEEHWTPGGGATMLGMTRVIEGGRTVWFEYLRLEERGDKLYYIAAPGGEDVVEFRRTSNGPGESVFENPANGFPTKITYRLAEGRVVARIEGELEGRPTVQEWIYTAMR
jgi:hypothetical protein